MEEKKSKNIERLKRIFGFEKVERAKLSRGDYLKKRKNPYDLDKIVNN